MTELEFPLHIVDQIDNEYLKEIVYEYGLEKDGGPSKILFDIINDLDKEEDQAEKELKFLIYSDFVLNTVKYMNNRVVMNFEIEISENSALSSLSSLLNFIGCYNLEDFFIFNHLEPKLNKDYKEIYRNIELGTNDEIKKLELVYGRIVKVEKTIKGSTIRDEVIKYEYIWIEIDCLSNQMKVSISENKKNLYTDKDSGFRNEIIYNFLPKVCRKYNFSIDDKSNESHTLFLIYKNLTENIEMPYSDQVSDKIHSKIEEITKDIKKDLEIKDNEDIGLTNRIIKLFERNLIKKDFKNFISKNNLEGRIEKVTFTDSVGGNVRASSGGNFGSESKDFDIQNSDIYFDIKETIYLVKKLQSIVVVWKNDVALPKDDRYKEVRVRYTAYNGFYETHFQFINVRKEVAEYVLPKFDEFKRRP